MTEDGQLLTEEFGVLVAETAPHISYRQTYRYWTPNAESATEAIEVCEGEWDEVLSDVDDVRTQVEPAPQKWTDEERQRYGVITEAEKP